MDGRTDGIVLKIYLDVVLDTSRVGLGWGGSQNFSYLAGLV